MMIFKQPGPLSSKHGILKIVCLFFFFFLRNLPPKFDSVLMNIHLISLFHTQDLHKYGFDVILEPLINYINYIFFKKKLESHGLRLPFSDKQIYCTISQITADNLRMHTILDAHNLMSHSVDVISVAFVWSRRMTVKLYTVGMILRRSFMEKIYLKCIASLSRKTHDWVHYMVWKKKNLPLIHWTISMFVITIHLR